MKLRSLLAILTFSAATTLAGVSLAGDKGDKGGKFLEACKADMERLCKNAGDDREARRKCMKDNEASLSAECKAAREKMRARRGEGKHGDKK